VQQLQAAAAAADATNTMAASAGAAAASPAAGPVSAEQEGVLRGVALKVEVLTALVAKMEHLVSRAEATARSLQVRVCCGGAGGAGGACGGGHVCACAWLVAGGAPGPLGRRLHTKVGVRAARLVAWRLCDRAAAWRACLAVRVRPSLRAQAVYRAEKFSMFPHVDSPAVLIKKLAAASAASQPQQAQRQQHAA
jgi:hypothetical protein